MKKWFHFQRLLGCLFLFAANASSGQSYGLAFASNEVVQDKRTGIDLSPGKMLHFRQNFELEFDVSVIPGKAEYFGYIVRLIAESRKNIDLIYDNSPKHFKIITGEKPPEISFNVTASGGFVQWHRIKLQFDAVNSELIVTSGNERFTQKIAIKENDSYKILFGGNNYGNFQTTDVPPIKLRDIKVFEAGALRYHWPLNEDEGSVATEMVESASAVVVNPRWIKKMHSNWQAVSKLNLQGPVSTAFDSRSGVLYFIAMDSLVTYHVNNGTTGSISYASQKLNLLRGNQSLFAKKQVYTIYPDQKIVSRFDSSSRSWDNNFISPAEITDNWHFNKFFSPEDSSIYLLSGYGHFVYKNGVNKVNVVTRKWDSVVVAGDFYTPRYLAALGAVKDGAYVMGGFGSQTGQQILNPRNVYDLMFFDRRARTFKSIYQLDVKSEDFAFANSLVIDERAGSYYGLIYPNHKYDATLQLVRGALDTPQIELLASKIPFRFHDIHAFADLFYDEISQTFIAVTLFWNDNNQTEISIFSLASPPLSSAAPESRQDHRLPAYLLIGAVLFTAALLLRRKLKSGKNNHSVEERVLPETEHPEAVAESERVEPMAIREQVPLVAEMVTLSNAVYLFGDLQLFDSESNDITRFFTPLLKELFLIILLYTVRKERGISSEKLKEILWFDKTAESARNNRSVNIAKLKSLLDKIEHTEVSKETGYWKIKFDPEKVHIDYFDCLTIINEKRLLDKQRIQRLSHLTRRGSFLQNLDYDWLEPFKSEITNLVIDAYLHYVASIRISDDPDLVIQIANDIFDFDSVNEDAMIMKCRALVFLGKHSLAKQSFESFNKEYKLLYGEEFSRTFQEILHQD